MSFVEQLKTKERGGRIVRRMIPLLAALLALVLAVPVIGGAEGDVCVLRAGVDSGVSTAASYIRVTCSLEEESDVSLSVYCAGRLAYQRMWTGQRGEFVSEDVYLPLQGGSTVYEVLLDVRGRTWRLTVTRTQPRLENNIATSCGYPLSWLNGQNTWNAVTFVNLRDAAIAPFTVPLQTGGYYSLGQVSFRVRGGRLFAEIALDPAIGAVVSSGTLAAAFTPEEIGSLGTRGFTGASGSPEEGIAVDGQSCAAVLLTLRVSFDPGAARVISDTRLDGQEELWLLMFSGGEPDANG